MEQRLVSLRVQLESDRKKRDNANKMDVDSSGWRGKPQRGGKSAVERLELEAAAMEQRLVSLRVQLESDRKKRDNANKDKPTKAGSFWANGQMGFVSTHAQHLVKDMKSNPIKSRKFKFLTENPNVDVTNVPHPPKCEKSQISHSIPISNDIVETEPCQRNAFSPIKHSLLDGCYDESESANSFKEALSEWRNCKSGTGTETMTSSTGTISQRKPIELPAFQPNQNLTYFDRLMLRKYKSEAVNNSVKKVSSPEIQSSVLRNSISEYNIFYDPEAIIESDDRYTEVLEITEIDDSDEGGDTSERGNLGDIVGPELKIVTQTNLSSFFLLGTAKSGGDESEIHHGVEDKPKLAKPMIPTMNHAWKPSESVIIESRNLDSNIREEEFSSDSDSDLPIEDLDGQSGAVSSEDDGIMTLERLSQELKTGIQPDGALWSDLMHYRPPTTNDFN